MRAVFFSSCFIAALASRAGAEPTEGEDEALRADEVKPDQFDQLTCKQKKRPITASVDTIPIALVDFDITGQLLDPVPTLRTLLAPTMQRHRVLSEDLREEAAAAAAAIGYHLVGLGTKDTPNGKHAQVHLSPMPIVRKVSVDISQSILDVLTTPLFEDEVRRRMRLRPGAYLPWDPAENDCELKEEKRRIERFLRDEGYFDAEATVVPKIDGARVTLAVKVELGGEYFVALDKIFIADSDRLPIDADKIRKVFKRERCLIVGQFCRDQRFTKASHSAGVQKVTELFQQSQYPGVRVRSTEPIIDRASNSVEFTLTIEPRRRVDVVFEGDQTATDETLAKQLTFNEAQSADDVEAAESARAIAAYLQTRGFFDVRVTWHRTQFPDANLDRLVYRISQGPSRTVRKVTFAGALALAEAGLRSLTRACEKKDADACTAVALVQGGDRNKAEGQLLDAIITKPIGRTAKLLGARGPATSANLTADVERIKGLYRRSGYRDARVAVSASTTPAALGSAAMTAALLSTDTANDIYVQFTIDAGLPTLLTQIEIDLDGKGGELVNAEQKALCAQVLADLADMYNTKVEQQGARCVAMVPDLLYRELSAADTRDLLKDRLFSRGRPRTSVELEAVPNGTHGIHMRYRIENAQQLKVGKIVVRGNFRTRASIILDELKQASFQETLPLTASALAESTRRLRNMGLFESVNVRLLDIDTTTAGALNAVVEVTERYDYPMGLDLGVGYSSFNGAFLNAVMTFKNLGGTGISLDLNGTAGIDVGDLVDETFTVKQLAGEATLRIPQWMSRRWRIPLQPQIELAGFLRQQDTPRFGVLKTTGASATLSRSKSFTRTATTAAHTVTGGFTYNYRRRERNIDVLRPIGADDDDSQVPIKTFTGSVGGFIEWEHRNDRSGQLQPLAPESGFRLEGQVSFTHPALSFYIGQDTFLKAAGIGSKYWPVGNHLVLRVDGRYDHGFPLGGAALLPEVERLFGGGDSTIRGYEDDRLATELIEVAVPPIDNVTQIRVLPAGGNIRALFSADAQLRIYKLLSTALFVDAGVITNQWSTVTVDDIRPSIGMALMRIVTPFGSFAWERAVPLRPRLGDDPRGRWHVSFAARAQF